MSSKSQKPCNKSCVRQVEGALSTVMRKSSRTCLGKPSCSSSICVERLTESLMNVSLTEHELAVSTKRMSVPSAKYVSVNQN